MAAALQAGGSGRGVVDVPLTMTAALSQAEAVLNARGDLQAGAGYAKVTARSAAGFDYRIFATVGFSDVAGGRGSVRAVRIGERSTRIRFDEAPSRTVTWLYALAALPLLFVLVAPDRGSAIGLLVFAASLAGMLYGLTRYVVGKSAVMARALAVRTGGRLAGAPN